MGKSEKRDIFGTSPDDWNLLHTIQPKSVSQEEYFSHDTLGITPEQHELSDKLKELVGDPRFRSASFVTIPLSISLWRDVERGNLTHQHGLDIERVNWEGIREETSYQPELFDMIAGLVRNPRFAMTDFVHTMTFPVGPTRESLGKYLTPEQLDKLDNLRQDTLRAELENRKTEEQ